MGVRRFSRWLELSGIASPVPDPVNTRGKEHGGLAEHITMHPIMYASLQQGNKAGFVLYKMTKWDGNNEKIRGQPLTVDANPTLP